MSRLLLRQFEATNDGIAALVEQDVRAFVASLDLARPEAAAAAVFEYVPVLIAQYGDIAATVAADWFEEVRAAEGIGGALTASMANNVPTAVVNGRLGFATRPSGPLYAADTQTLADFLAIMANEYALQPGRDTVMRLAHKDGAAYARVPEPGACKFCLMLASRGFVYSKDSATKKADGGKFHGNCRCNAMPVWDETRARVEYGYDPDALYELYLDTH